MTNPVINRGSICATRRGFLGIVAGLGTALVVKASASPAEAAGVDLLRFGTSSYPPGLRPFQHAGAASTAVKLMVNRGLLGYNYDGAIQGEVAEKWELEGERTLVFHLRKNAVFHNGDAVTAEDVAHSIEQIRSKDATAYLRDAFASIEAVTVVDAQTIKVTLKSPSAPFVHHLASAHAAVISRKSTDTETIGCGSYQISDQERGRRIKFKAFDRYYRSGFPKIKNVDFVVYADERLRVAALQTGDVDLIEFVPWQDMKAIEARNDLHLDDPDEAFMGIIYNMKQGPFRDPKVRQAVAYGVNRQDIIKAAFFGRGTPMEGIPFPRASPLYDAALQKRWAYDPDKARKLLAEAGLANGFSTTLLSTAQYGMHKDTAEVVQQSLAGIGIQVELKMPDWATRVQLGNKGQYEFAITGYALDYNDPDALSNLLTSSPAGSYLRSYGYENPQMDDLFSRGRAELDTAKRKEIYGKLTQVALDDAALVGLVWRSQAYAMKKSVTHYRTMPGALNYSLYLMEGAEIA